jgi:signal transduction histidine kinase
VVVPSRAEAAVVAEEQAALRRVATLVAPGVSQEALFAAVTQEIGWLVGADPTALMRFEPDDRVTMVAAWSVRHVDFPIGSSRPLDEELRSMRETGRPWRRAPADLPSTGPFVEEARALGIRTAVGVPIVVEGRVWGFAFASSTADKPFADNAEARLENFTELVAAAIANAQTQADVRRLAEEQAALRRVATRVAEESSPEEVFGQVVEEVGHVLGDVDTALFRDESDGTATIAAAWGAGMSATTFPAGTWLTVGGDGVTAPVRCDGRPRRVDDHSVATGVIADICREHGMRSAVGCPVVVRGRIWGVMAVARFEGAPLPAETEARITQFSELLATAIANAEARAEVERLAEEQAALRRVATLVAEGAAPSAVFEAVAAEMEGLLGADQVALGRYEPGDVILVLAHRGPDVARTPVRSRLSHDGESVTATVRRTGRPARMEDFEGAPGALAELARTTGLTATVGAPIVVDGRLWGVITASWKAEPSPSADTEERMTRFAQLLETAIANADSRDQLTTSRARLLTEADHARRRVVRDLHDGAQQRLVQTILTLKLTQRALQQKDGEAQSLVAEALRQAEQGNAELRELAHGILPTALTRGGLRAGVDTVAVRIDLPVQTDVTAERFPADTEASAYFIVAEALTNVVKHSHATHAEVRATVENEILHIEICDDGIGGADPDGHGLLGIGDRVTALGGQLKIDSPPSGGTLIAATLPLSAV